MLAAPENKEINKQVKVTWRTLCTIAHSLMVHAQVLEDYIHITFMYLEDNIFLVILIKDFINIDSNQTIPFKLTTVIKPFFT